MGAKRKGPPQKKRIIRHEVPDKSANSATSPIKEASSDREKPQIRPRTKEKDSGLGVLKVVGFIIIALVVGSAILFNRSGGREAMRGDKSPGESCEKTVECQKGSVCYTYKDSNHQCMKTCSKERPCQPGYTCVSEGSRKRGKGIRVIPVCVEDAKL